jgi:hypothetical protein
MAGWSFGREVKSWRRVYPEVRLQVQDLLKGLLLPF